MRGKPSTCCFTGHRPEKLPWGSDETDPRCKALKQKLQDAVSAAYDEGMRHFICGMARGCDFYFAEAVLALRAEKQDVTLEAAVPCPTQADNWPDPAGRLRRGNYCPEPLHGRLYAPPQPVHGGPQRHGHRRLRRHKRRYPQDLGVRSPPKNTVYGYQS